jgi:hypothetical protein
MLVDNAIFQPRLSSPLLSPTPYSIGNRKRCAFYISGGLLSRKVDPAGRLEFRLFPELKCLVASIHGFAPTLPWWLYANTQARIHLHVMMAFSKHLQRLSAVRGEKPETL